MANARTATPRQNRKRASDETRRITREVNGIPISNGAYANVRLRTIYGKRPDGMAGEVYRGSSARIEIHRPGQDMRAYYGDSWFHPTDREAVAMLQKDTRAVRTHDFSRDGEEKSLKAAFDKMLEAYIPENETESEGKNIPIRSDYKTQQQFERARDAWIANHRDAHGIWENDKKFIRAALTTNAKKAEMIRNSTPHRWSSPEEKAARAATTQKPIVTPPVQNGTATTQRVQTENRRSPEERAEKFARLADLAEKTIRQFNRPLSRREIADDIALTRKYEFTYSDSLLEVRDMTRMFSDRFKEVHLHRGDRKVFITIDGVDWPGRMPAPRRQPARPAARR